MESDQLKSAVERIAREATFLTTKEAAFMLGLQPATLVKYRCKRSGGPRYHKHGGRIVYALGDLLAWSEQRAFD